MMRIMILMLPITAIKRGISTLNLEYRAKISRSMAI
jgi:hypothetical protein